MLQKHKISLVLYRSLLRLESTFNKVTLEIAEKHNVCRKTFLRQIPLRKIEQSIEENRPLRSIIRQSFEEPCSDPDEILTKQQSSFIYIQLLHSRLHQYQQPHWKPRNPSVKFKVGQIVLDKYRREVGVICGYDDLYNTEKKLPISIKRTLRRTSKAGQLGLSQPFYTIIFDYGKEYLPEEYLSLASKKDLSNHLSFLNDQPTIFKYFERFSPELTQFMPNEELMQAYPDD